jgi:hypothetical protein
MSGKWQGGKGSYPRPITDRQKFRENWDRIFGKKEPEILEAWSANDDDYNCIELSDLLNNNDYLSAGDTVYVGRYRKYKPSDLFNVEWVIEQFENAAWDLGGEYAESVLDNVDAAAEKELEDMLEAWIAKYLKIDFYQVIDTKPYVLTEEDF